MMNCESNKSVHKHRCEKKLNRQTLFISWRRGNLITTVKCCFQIWDNWGFVLRRFLTCSVTPRSVLYVSVCKKKSNLTFIFKLFKSKEALQTCSPSLAQVWWKYVKKNYINWKQHWSKYFQYFEKNLEEKWNMKANLQQVWRFFRKSM